MQVSYFVAAQLNRIITATGRPTALSTFAVFHSKVLLRIDPVLGLTTNSHNVSTRKHYYYYYYYYYY